MLIILLTSLLKICVDIRQISITEISNLRNSFQEESFALDNVKKHWNVLKLH